MPNNAQHSGIGVSENYIIVHSGPVGADPVKGLTARFSYPTKGIDEVLLPVDPDANPEARSQIYLFRRQTTRDAASCSGNTQ